MSLEENRADARGIIDELRSLNNGQLRIKLGAQQANYKIMQLANKLIREGKGNQVLTRIMRLPYGVSAALLEYINGTRPYDGQDPRLTVTLKNIGPAPIKIVMNHRFFPDLTAEGEEIPDAGTFETIRQTIAPGEQVTVAASVAVHALHEHCKDAYNTEWQSRWPHDRDVIREVGYSALVDGEQISIPSKRGR